MGNAVCVIYAINPEGNDLYQSVQVNVLGDSVLWVDLKCLIPIPRDNWEWSAKPSDLRLRNDRVRNAPPVCLADLNAAMGFAATSAQQALDFVRALRKSHDG